jgi:hypothetical protein
MVLMVEGCYKLVSELVCRRQVVCVVLPDNGFDGRGMLQIGIRAMVSTLSLDGMDNSSLDPRFQVEIVSRETNFEP